jgi:mitosis inhibitor protein kinase SWE1
VQEVRHTVRPNSPSICAGIDGYAGWQLPPPRIPPRLSPLKSSIPNHLALNRTASSSSDASTVTTLASPTGRRQARPRPQTICGQEQNPLQGNGAHSKRASLSGLCPSLETYEQSGRFEREFVEIGELGSGEFGKVMKVRRQNGLSISGTSGEVTAVKKSKRFEGIRHR